MPQYLGQVARDLNAEKILTVHHSKYALARHRWEDVYKRQDDTVHVFMQRALATIAVESLSAEEWVKLVLEALSLIHI